MAPGDQRTLTAWPGGGSNSAYSMSAWLDPRNDAGGVQPYWTICIVSGVFAVVFSSRRRRSGVYAVLEFPVHTGAEDAT